jgi:sugar lactone lactonase YvrE
MIPDASTEWTFSTLAGLPSTAGSTDGMGPNGRFRQPHDVAVDSTGNVFVADFGNSTIRKITPAGVVSTFAGAALQTGSTDGAGAIARFWAPRGLAIDGSDNLFVSDFGANTIRKITPAGIVSTFAGTPQMPGSTDATGPAARFRNPAGLDFDSAGNLFVVESTNNTIRKITPAAVVTTVAGSPLQSGSTDATGAAARFNNPDGIAIDSHDNLFVADRDNNKVRKITPAGVVTTFAGIGLTGYFDATGTSAWLFLPSDVSVDASDNLFLADSFNCAIRKITPGAVVTSVAGGPPPPGVTHCSYLDGTGSAARFLYPTGISLDGAGNMYVADESNNTIRKVTPAGVVTTLAGISNIGYVDGPGADARFMLPFGIAVDPASGNVYVADTSNRIIRRITPGGTVTTMAGLAGVPGFDDGVGSAARFGAPHAMAVDAGGNVYIVDFGLCSIRKMTPAGVVSTLAGDQLCGDGLAFDAAGNLFVSGSSAIRKVTPGGVVTTYAGTLGVPGSNDGPAASAHFKAPTGLTVDPAGNLWVLDSTNYVIRKISPNGIVSTVAGLVGVPGFPDGTGSTARFNSLVGIASDAGGNLFVTDLSRIRMVTPAGVTTTVGGAQGPGFMDGVGSVARFGTVKGIASTPDGTLYIADYGNSIIRKAVPPPNVAAMAPLQLSFAGTKAGAAGALTAVTPPQSVNVSFSRLPAGWTATSDVPWLQVTSGTGTGTGQFNIGVINPANVIGGATNLAGTVTLTSSAANSPIQVAVALTIDQTGAGTAAPFGQVDSPSQNASSVQGAIGVSGWVLDDVGVAGVKIYRNCLAPSEPAANCATGLVPGNPSLALAFIGDAAFVDGARPDLEEAFPDVPRSYHAGWGYLMLSNMLPRTAGGTFAQYGGQGPLTLYAIATDMEGQRTLLGRIWNTPPVATNITMTNDTIAKPFGAIDTPLQGGTASTAVFGNFGWVLTPDLNTVADGTDILIPTNGSTMFVYLDGVAAANVTFNQCRGSVGNPPPGGVYCDDDVASIFGNLTPQAPLTPRASNPTKYRNLDAGRGPQGSYALDTTSLTNGLHSIAWSATDSNGRIEGIGSRNFFVFNGGARALSETVKEQLLRAPAESRGSAGVLTAYPLSKRPVSVRTGFDPRTTMKEIERGRDSVRSVSVPLLGRLELGFASPVSAAYLQTGGTLRDLPVGSRLDRKTGVFAWTPPLGYLGRYRLVFVLDGERVVVDVTVGEER